MSTRISHLTSCFPCYKPAFVNTGSFSNLSEHEFNDKIDNWLFRWHDSMSGLTNVLPNGLYSLLNKELSKAVDCLAEAELLTHHPFFAVSGQTPDTVRSHFIELKGLVAQVKDVCSAHEAEIAEDQKLEKKWIELGLPESVLEKHADCARFLIKTNLIYSMLGYLETSQDPEMHGLKLDGDGHPLIKKEGVWTRWENIKDLIDFETNDEVVIARDNAQQKWNYFHPNGLVPVDRFNFEEVYPIYRLSLEEYERLRLHAQRFYEVNPRREEGDENCVVQFFTSPRKQGIPTTPLLANLHRGIPVHIGIRIITGNRDVYSFGFQMPESQQRQINANFVPSKFLSTFFMTGTARISMLDYEEFRKHEGRMVTSIPLTANRAQNMLDRLNGLNRKPQLRFQFARQNCSSLMNEMMQEAGYDVDVRSSVGSEIRALFPNAHQLPLIGPLIGKVQRVIGGLWITVVKAMPQIIKDGFSWLDRVILYIPRKMGNFTTNLIALQLGANKYTCPLESSIKEEVLSNNRRIQSFSRVIRSWKDMFQKETSAANHSRFFLEWQRKQSSTHVFAPKARPSLCIVPSPDDGY